jgi:hypothetical protein
MKYGIVVCSKCKKAKIVDLSYKTTKCIICKKTLNISKINISYKSDSQKQIRQVIGKINSEIMKD